MPSGKPGKVLDVGRGGQLAASGDTAGHEALEEHRAQLGACGVNRRGVGCRSAADDQDAMAHETPFEAGVMHTRRRVRNP